VQAIDFPLAKPLSSKNYGTCVVLPLPVSPCNTIT